MIMKIKKKKKKQEKSEDKKEREIPRRMLRSSS
jgi:hypothetical protein